MQLMILDVMNQFLNVEPVEEAFYDILVYDRNTEEEKTINFINATIKNFTGITQEGKEAILRQYLLRAGDIRNVYHLKVLISTLGKVQDEHLISAKTLCDKILACEKLTLERKHFWVECFNLIKKIICYVDYKGVREILKACRDRVQTFSRYVNYRNEEQWRALKSLIEYIFDRNNSLLPAYFVANEILKPFPYHWVNTQQQSLNKLNDEFLEEFRKTAQMVTIIGQQHMLPIVEHCGYADHLMISWKLDYNTLKFIIKGNLPYEPELMAEQAHLLCYVLEQTYSKEMVSLMLSLPKQQKQRCNTLEEQLVNVIIKVMQMTETNDPNTAGGLNVTTEEQICQNEWIWFHLSSQLIHFVLFQFVGFLQVILSLYDKLAKLELRKGRDHLMWILLQFISGSIQKNPISNFLPMFKLLDLLYPEQEPLNLPDCSKSSSLRQMAPICIWIHLMKKARIENINIAHTLPVALKNHHDFLQHLILPNSLMTMNLGTDFRIILLCNAYSTNQDFFNRPLNILLDSLSMNAKTNSGASAPLSVLVLDSLTVHSKMSVIHGFITQMMKLSQTKTSIPTSPLIETYARLLVYTEIESMGMKSFTSQLLPTVFKNQAWGILHILLEMFSYRLHHIPSHYRINLLSQLHSLTSMPQSNKMQLNLCFESTALRIINAFGSAEIQPQFVRFFNDKSGGSLVSNECEELNRVLILTLARSMHCTGSGDEMQPWCKELLNTIMQNTPHSWAAHSLVCFPPALAEFFSQNNHPVENKQLLKKSVEEEYRNWTSMTNENDVINHFLKPNSSPLFLCLLYKMIWEAENISPVAYKILESISSRMLSTNLRKLCDYLVNEVASSNGKEFIHKCVDSINNMIWKYNIVTIDRVVLCLGLRTQEGSEAQVCFIIIQLLLLKASELRSRVTEFCKENNPDHWIQSNWHEKHMAFHQKYPEKFAPDESATHAPLPVYFSNVCLRFLPVLDVIIHRFIEFPIQHVHQIFEVILDHLSILYKFHDRPITYMYNTLHFYERVLRDRPSLKKKLVSSITGAFCEIRPSNWCFSDKFKMYLQSSDLLWNPDLHYYIGLIRRLSETISGKNVFYKRDWRFSEFPNAPAHAKYVTCLELLSLPLAPSIVANNLFDVLLKGYAIIPQNEIFSYINTIGIILAELPEAYWCVMYDRLQDVLNSPQMLRWNYTEDAFQAFNFQATRRRMVNKVYAATLAIVHAVLHHMGCFKLGAITKYIKEKLKACVRNECQLVYLCHAFGPFLQRIEHEKPNAVAGITILIYEMLEAVDKQHGPNPLQYMDPICDLLYHIKYIYVGNIIKNESEAIIKRLRPALQKRLRFITHLNIDEKLLDKTAEVATANPFGQQANLVTSNQLPTTSSSSTNIHHFANVAQQQQSQLQSQQQRPSHLSLSSAAVQQQLQQQQSSASNVSHLIELARQNQQNQQQQQHQLQQMQLQQQQMQQLQQQQQFQLQQQQMQHMQQQQQPQQQQQMQQQTQSTGSNAGSISGLRHN